MNLTENTIGVAVEQYASLRDKKAAIDAQMKKLATQIKDYATVHGNKDDKGSYYIDSKDFLFGAQHKQSVSLDNDKALAYFKSHGLESYIKTQEYIESDDVDKLSAKGTIPFEDVEGMCKVKSSYSVLVKAKADADAVPEVQVSEVSMPIAASRKPKRIRPARKG